jgi:Tfp pilus assembly protein PilO
MKRLHLFIILAAALLLVAWFLVWPAAQSVLMLRQEKSVWESKLKEAQQYKKTLADLEKKYKEWQDEESRILDAIPNKGDLPGLLVQLEAMASQNGLILNSLNFVYPQVEKLARAVVPDADTSGNKTDSDNSVISSVSASEQIPPSNVNTLAVSMELVGDYVSLKNFLKAIENNLRLSDVMTVLFSQQGRGGQSQTFESGKLSIGLNVYYKK